MFDLILDPSTWFSLAAGAFLVLGVYVWFADSGGLMKAQLLLLSVAGLLWNVRFSAISRDVISFSLDTWSYLTEMVILIAWFFVLYRLLLGPYKQSMPELIRRFLYLFWAVTAFASVIVVWLVIKNGESVWIGQYYAVLGLGMALACLALSAQLMRDTPIEGPAALMAFSGGAGAFSGAQILLLGVIVLGGSAPSGVLLVSGVVSVVSAFTILFAVYQAPQWSLEIFVSPQPRGYVPRLFAAVGAMLLTLAVWSWFRGLPPGRAQWFSVLLILSVGIPVSVLLFSQTLSARMRVVFSKHFLPFRYDYREEWLRLIDTLASPENRLPLPERAIQAVAQIVGSPAGVLWMLRSDKGPYVCSANWNTRLWSEAHVSPDDQVLEFMCKRQWILDTAELKRDPGLYDGLTRPDWLEHFPDGLLVVPLISHEDLIAFVVLFQSSSAFRLTYEEIDLLRTSGRQVAAHLAQYEADQKLAESKQFEAFNRLTAFVMHDLKNLIAQQSLVVKNAARHKNNPAFFEDAVATVENSVVRMNKLLQQLQGGEAGAGPREKVRLASILSEAVGRCGSRKPSPHWKEEALDLFAYVDREGFTSVLAHVIRNAQEATGQDGQVNIGLVREKGDALITVKDNGCGMEPEFIRDRLFRPFDSTKGSQGMGIGAYQARALVVDSGGVMEVQSTPGKGSCFFIRMPAVAVDFEAQ